MASQITPSHPHDSPLDHRSLLNVFSWCLLITSVIVVLIRLVMRWIVIGSIGLDDIFIFFSTVPLDFHL